MRSTTAHLSLDHGKLDAVTASLRSWFVALLVWFTALAAASKSPLLRSIAEAALKRFGPRIRADLRLAIHDLERVLFLRAMERLRFSKRTPMRGGPPRMVTHIPVRVLIRATTRGMLTELKTGPLHQRARLLRLVLDNSEPFIARIVARLHEICGRFRVLKPAPPLAPTPAAPLAAAPALARACADTS